MGLLRDCEIFANLRWSSSPDMFYGEDREYIECTHPSRPGLLRWMATWWSWLRVVAVSGTTSCVPWCRAPSTRQSLCIAVQREAVSLRAPDILACFSLYRLWGCVWEGETPPPENLPSIPSSCCCCPSMCTLPVLAGFHLCRVCSWGNRRDICRARTILGA